MLNWYDIHSVGRVLHTDRLAEAEQHRLFARTATRVPAATLRSRLGQALISLGRWVDGRSDAPARYGVERTGAR